MDNLVAGLTLSLTLLVVLAYVVIYGKWSTKQITDPDSQLVSAFKSQPWWSLACSFFAAAFGASALAANPEAGAEGGWVSAIAYGLANAAPYWCLIVIGPRLQEILGTDGFSITDFVYQRFGRPMHLLSSLLSIFFMFIWLSAELTSASEAFNVFAPNFPSWVAIVIISLCTAFYALFAGFKTSLITDRLQAVSALVIVIVLVIGIFASIDIDSKYWREASTMHGADWSGGGVLILSTTINQFLDLGSWQRILASQSPRDGRLGLLAAGTVNFGAQSLIAIMGIAGAAAIAGDMMPGKGNPFFGLLSMCHPFFSVLTLILVIMLTTSTVDSLQNALAVAFAAELLRRRQSLHWARVIALLFIIPATILALTHQSVISLFLLSNIFSMAIVPPIFLGFSPTLSTPKSAIIGFASGVLSIFICGFIFAKSFLDGLKWPMFPEGFAHWSTLVTFIVVPLVSVSLTIATAKFEQRYHKDPTNSHHTVLANDNKDSPHVSIEIPYIEDLSLA